MLIDTANSPWLVAFLTNVGISTILLLAYSLVRAEIRIERRPFIDLLIGLLFGLCGVLSLRFGIIFADGSRTDACTVFVLVSGLFGGPIGALVAGSLSIAYRLWLGGPGTIAGVVVFAVSGAFGAALAMRFGDRARKLRPYQLYLIGLAHMALIAVTVEAVLWFSGAPTLPLEAEAVGFIVFPISVVLLGIAMSITDYRIWRRAQGRLSDYVEVSTDLVWEQDAQGRWTYLSERYRDMLGGDPALSIGKTVADSGARWLDAENEQAARAAHAARLPYSGLIGQARAQDGSYKTLLLSARPIFDERGRFAGYRGTAHDITKQQQAEEALRRSRDRLAHAQKVGRMGSTKINLITGESDWSDEMYTILGLDPKTTAPSFQTHLACVHPDDRAKLEQARNQDLEGDPPDPCETRIVRPDGEIRWTLRTSEVERDAAGKPVNLLVTHQDITEQKRGEERRIELEHQLAQAQKMEAIGQLTGGVAHDFNNLLAVILGRLQMLAEELADDPRLRDWVQSSIRAAERGASLTKSLLAFSRQQSLAPVELDLRQVVGDTEEMLRQALGESFALRVAIAPGLWPVEADPGQLQNALLNLVFNSRDAMPKGGTVAITLFNISVTSENRIGPSDLKPGDYVVLSISDTGVGMAREVVERAFEPFYTTKDVGKGTGLGLSMVYGFVKQTGGHVAIESGLNQGTTISLYLPRKAKAGSVAPARGAAQKSAPRGAETILVVEDNEDMRVLTRLQLERLGYTVLEAAHGAEGLRVLAENANVDLLLTDVMMPKGMSGPELAERAVSARRDLKVVFMSGYNELHDALGQTHGRGPVRLLQKPFRVAELAAQMREALG